MTEILNNSEIETLKAQMEQVQQEMARMKAEQATFAPATTEPTSRRRMLKKLGIGAAAAGLAVTGMAATNSSEASANNGDPVVLGKSGATPNIATSATEIRSTSTNPNGALFFVQQGSKMNNPVGLQSYGAIVALTDGTGEIHDGVYGQTFDKIGSGVAGRHSASVAGQDVAGVAGFGFEAPGVLGKSDNAAGVKGTGANIGVEGVASGSGGIGTYGEGKFAGLFGLGHRNPGVIAQADVADARFPIPQLRLVKSVFFGDSLGLSQVGETGDFLVDSAGILWFCVKGKSAANFSDAKWLKLAGVKTAGQLHVMPSPERLIDTRFDLVGANDPKGQVTGFAPADKPATANIITYTITERAGANGEKVPAGATAITGNVTVVVDENAAGGGFMTMWPAGGAVPATSTLNYKPGQVAFNNFTVGLSTDGKLSVAAFRNLHIIIDVTGYYL